MTDPVTLSRDGDVGVIMLVSPPVNALSTVVIDGIRAAFEALTADAAVRAIVLTGSGKAFCGGADIKLFDQLRSGAVTVSDLFNPLLNALEDSAKPIVAAINGTCLGGGLELAMACHYRVAAPGAQVGQPEVKLGLIPGAGGTQRLPRLAGLAKAAELCATGRPISAADALNCGIVDRVVEGDLVQEAVCFAHGVTGSPRRTRDLTVPPGPADANVLAAVRDQVRARAPQLLAPIKAIDAVEAAGRLPFAEGLRFEAELFQDCLLSEQSKGLIHVFFSEREVGKVPGLAKDTPVLPVRRAAVVGAGTMGGGIAMAYANAGIPVALREVSQVALDRGMATIQKDFAATVQKGRLSQAEADRRVGLIRPTLSFDGFEDADVVVEAVFENLELKTKVFAELDQVARPDAILATTTSTLDVDVIAATTSRPQRVIGHHFFSPANVMRLVEIVRGRQTSPTVIATSLALAKAIGKVGVLVGNGRGFIGNRLFFPYLREAQLLVHEGATVEAVDAALTDFGMAMGPFAVKAGPAVAHLIEETGRAAGGRRRTVSTDEMVERPIFALINEGAKVLQEGIALRAADVDVIYIHGYGFPPHRGGPIWYADTVGLPKVLDRVRQFERELDAAWKPAELLRRLAAEGKTFADYDRERAR